MSKCKKVKKDVLLVFSLKFEIYSSSDLQALVKVEFF